MSALRQFILVCVCLLALLTSAHAQTNSCTTVSNGTQQDITAFSVCKRVTNNSGLSVCAVTNVSSGQWQSFYDNPPSGVTIANCSASCTGYSYGGYCYYYGGRGQSCDSVCANLGGCVAAGVQYIGSSAPSFSRCIDVLLGLGLADDSYTSNAVRMTSPTSTCAGAPPIFSYSTPPGAFCACAGQASSGTASCALPWGGSIAHGQQAWTFVTNTSSDCVSQRDIRTCYNGVLTGSGTYQTCSSPCTGYSYGGYCYRYSGASYDSCDAVCASYGGCNLAGTRAIGSNGSDAACQAVASGLGLSVSWGGSSSGLSTGCFYSPGKYGSYLYRYTDTTSCSVSDANVRLCACNS